MQKLFIEINEILCFYEFLDVLQKLHKLEKILHMAQRSENIIFQEYLFHQPREAHTFSRQKSNTC